MPSLPRRRNKRSHEFRSPADVARVYGPDWREKAARLLQDWIAELRPVRDSPPISTPTNSFPPSAATNSPQSL
jgi:hypothetical protein